MLQKKLTLNDLKDFTGGYESHHHWFTKRVLYTQGIQHLIKHGEAAWLIDEIAFAQVFKAQVQKEEFQVWYLKPTKDDAAWLVCEDGNRNRIYRQRIPYTNLDIPGLKIWCVHNTIMLPSEY